MKNPTLKARANLIKAQTQLEDSKLKSEKFKLKQEEKKEKKLSKLAKKYLTNKVTSKRLLKPSQSEVNIREHTPSPYVSRYFKDEMKQAQKEMFFS